jgi:ACS family allantoate permease-like MFS transporter
VAWSIVTFFYLPDSPQTARFLSESEREFAALRPYQFQKTVQTRSWDRGQFIESLKDIKTWWFFLFSFVICVPNGGVTSVCFSFPHSRGSAQLTGFVPKFNTIVINGFGYDKFETILMGLPASAFQLLTVILSAVISSTVRKSRLITLVFIFLMAMAGILMVKLLPQTEKLSRLAGFWLVTAVSPAFPLMSSLAASNVAGFTKKSTVMAMIFLAYCAGNLSGPQFFISTEAPGYHVGIYLQHGINQLLTVPCSDCVQHNCDLLCHHHYYYYLVSILSHVGERSP